MRFRMQASYRVAFCAILVLPPNLAKYSDLPIKRRAFLYGSPTDIHHLASPLKDGGSEL
jgi:hypothetical protein